NGFLDGRTVLARRSFLGFRANKALRENGQHPLKRFSPFSLLAEHSAHYFTFASPLTITVRKRASDVLPYLLPGWGGALASKFIQRGPEHGQRSIDDDFTCIEETKRIGLRFIGQAQIVG